MEKILNSEFGRKFLMEQAESVLKFGLGAKSPNGGFGYLDSKGAIDKSKARECYEQARFTHVYSLAHMMQLGDFQSEIDFGISSINELFRDQKAGGYFNSIDESGASLVNEKLAYDQAFILLAATSALAAGNKDAGSTFSHIDSIIDNFFWDDQYRMVNNHWDAGFRVLDSYRGINANMHSVEAFLAAYEVTLEEKFLDRAASITDRTINDFARPNNWYLPEHFDSNWSAIKEFNADKPADPFRPYGVTIGHLFEWSRLALHLNFLRPKSSLVEAAIKFYELAKEVGWSADGKEGFVYTVDWQGKPVTNARMWWVVAEAVMTAFALYRQTSDETYLNDYVYWWRYIEEHFIDRKYGSWHAELDANHQVVAGTWPGKPDIYHIFQAAIFPLIRESGSFSGALK